MRRRSGRMTAAPALGFADAPDERQEIAEACDRMGLRLVGVIGGGFDEALDRLSAGEARCVVAGRLDALAAGGSELAPVLARIEDEGLRVIALDIGLDTGSETGRLALAPRPRPRPEWMADEPEVAAEAADVAGAPVIEEAPAVAPGPPPPPAAATTPFSDISVAAIGYACAEEGAPAELAAQREAIERSCAVRGLQLIQLVGDREPRDGKAVERPGLTHVLQRLAAGDASCLVVAGLFRLSRSVGELGQLVRWMNTHGVRLVAIDIELDTATPAGQSTARTLASVADWQRERISERTRKGLAAARAKRDAEAGDDGVEWTAVRKRIAEMRARGMTLQAIADVLNEEGVPTQRGGLKWRPSSVHTAAGYRRPSRSRSIDALGASEPPEQGDGA